MGTSTRLNFEIIPIKNAPSKDRFYLVVFEEGKPFHKPPAPKGANKTPVEKKPAKASDVEAENAHLREELDTLLIQEITSKRKEETLRASSQQMRDLAAGLEAVREEERTRVAREIHDELGQALTVLKLDLSWIKTKMPPKAETRRKVKDMIAQVDETIRKVRRISEQLRPAILDDLGLAPAIEWQVTEFQKRTKIQTEIVSNADELRLPNETAGAVFRVVQEALTNVIRHAKATRVELKLRLQDGMLMVSIQDNGKGMSQKPNGLKTLGILGMQERISRIGGQFNVLSEPGQGTRLDILIPTNK
jgi:two-component system, NarL family, sensor histidine kinase UhpB